MTLAQWLGLATWVGLLGLTVLAFVRGRRAPLAMPLSMLCMAMFVWTFAEWATGIADRRTWRSIDLTFSSLAAPAALYFVLAFVGARRRLRWLLLAFGVPFGLLSLACASALVLDEGDRFARSVLRGRIQGALIVALLVVGLTLLARHARAQTNAQEKVRSALVMAALALGGVLGAADVLGTRMPIPSALLSTGLLALAVLRFELIEREGTGLLWTYVGALAIGAVAAYLLALQLFAASYVVLALSVIAISAVLSAAFYHAQSAGGAVREERERFAMLGRLSAQMAHDLKNPLAAVKGAAQLLQEERAQGRSIDDQAELLALFVQESDRMARLIDRHRRLSRLEPAREAVDVGALVRRLVELRRLSVSPGQQLELELTAELPRCEVDADLLVTALENLVTNAFEAIACEGRVVVRALPGEGAAAELVLEVEDDGAGMDPRQLERATDGSFTTKAQGSGLGLAFARRVAEAHGGRLLLSSKQGQGTRARMHLPCLGAPALSAG